MEKKFIENYKIYKPNKNSNGSASQFCFSKEKKAIFLEMASQSINKDVDGNATFDWKTKLIYKLGAIDIAEILLVLHNFKNSVGYDNKGLYHSSGDNNAILRFQKGDKSGYYLGISVKKGESAPVALKHSITDAEGMILRVLLEESIRIIYDWQYVPD